MEDWIRIEPNLSGSPSETHADYNSWLLVLRSKSIPFKLERHFSGLDILVPSHYAEIAQEEIRVYEEENIGWAPVAQPAQAWKVGYTLTLCVLFALAVLNTIQGFAIGGLGHSVIPWLKVGAADASRILDGEWWRTITALMLHGDAGHIIGNLVIGGFFAQWLTRDLGGGLAWFLILLTGIMGNYMNAFAQTLPHISIGASTAVFGAMGLLCGIRIPLGTSRLREVAIPVFVGLVLLGMLGTAGERTDVGAHIFGMVSGLGVGAVTAYWIKQRGYPRWWHQALYGFAAIAIPVIAWWVGLSLRG